MDKIGKTKMVGKRAQHIHGDDLIKGTRMFCLGCDAHLLTLSEDVYGGEIIHSGQFDHDDGQKFDLGEIMKCKMCAMPFVDRDGFFCQWETPC